MTQLKRKTYLCKFRCKFLVNLSFNRAITLHLSTIGLYTLNVCPVKSLFKRRNCRVIDDKQTKSQTDWASFF